MASNFIDYNAPSLQGQQPKLPKDLPHGLLPPPELVQELLAREFARHPNLSEETKVRTLNDWTLQYYFDYLNYEVLYRRTPEGPEVQAVGFDEMQAFTKDMPLAEQLQLQIWMP